MTDPQTSQTGASTRGPAILQMARSSRATFWLALVSGLAFSLFGVSQWLGFSRPAWLLVAGWLVLFGLGFVGAAYTLEKIIRPTLSRYTPWQRLTWWGACLVGGLYLVYQLPLTVLPLPQRLVFTATGMKNPQALGSEVWLSGIQEGRKNLLLDLSRVCQGEWTMMDDQRVSATNQPARLVCLVEADGPITVMLVRHPWSGTMRLKFDDTLIERDLFAENGQEVLNLTVQLTQGQIALRVGLFLADGWFIGWLLLVASAWLVGRGRADSVTRPKTTTPGWVFGVLLGMSWLLYLLAFWPGFLSPDTIGQLKEVYYQQFYNWHPAFHTLTLWLLTRIWFNPVPVVIVQILVLSSLLGYGLGLIQRQGVPTWLTWLLAGFYALAPAFGMMVLTLWKDMAYALAVLGLALLTLKILTTHGEWLKRPAAWLLLGGTAALCMLFRHNGWPVAVGTLLLIGVAFAKYWKSILAAGLVMMGIWAFVTVFLFRVIDVKTDDPAKGSNLGVEYTTLGLALWHARYGTPIQPSERPLLELINIEDFLEEYRAIRQATPQINQLAIQLTRRAPLTTLRFFVNRAAFIFQVMQPWQSRYEFVTQEIAENPFAFQADSQLPGLQAILDALVKWSENPARDWFFWRNAFWMYLLIFAALVASLRERNARLLILLGPVLLNALPLALLSAGQLSRYILPTLLISPLFCAWLLAGGIPQERRS